MKRKSLKPTKSKKEKYLASNTVLVENPDFQAIQIIGAPMPPPKLPKKAKSKESTAKSENMSNMEDYEPDWQAIQIIGAPMPPPKSRKKEKKSK